MLILLQDLQLIYAQILEQRNLSQSRMLIFSSFDTDAVCSVKIITSLLQTQSINYEVIPVCNYTELEQKIEESQSFKDTRMIFFINCGGGLDLTQKWFSIGKNEDIIKLFLLDNHKPIHHANIESKHIKVINDGDSNFDRRPTHKDFIRLEKLEEQIKCSEEDNNFLGEQQRVKQQTPNPRRHLPKTKKKKTSKAVKSESEDHEDDDYDLDQEQSPQPDEQKQNESQNIKDQNHEDENAEDQSLAIFKKREIKQRKYRQSIKERYQINQKIQVYYSHQYVGLPSSVITYRLARDVNKSCNDYLWYSMIGLSSLFHDQKISKQTFDKCQVFHSNEMMKLNPINKNNSETRGSILREIDFRFVVMKHWTLYDSIRYSPYMVSKMKLWSEDGKKRLLDFITKVGVSQSQARQLNTFMSNASMNQLRKQILKKAEEFQLLDVYYNSYLRKIDNYDFFSCSDFACAVTAALETFDEKQKNFSANYKWRVECFWKAYNLLHKTKHQDLKGQIENYKTWSKLLIHQALNILEKGQINVCGKFCYVKYVLTNSEVEAFTHPLRMVRFGSLLMHLFHEKKEPNKPIIKPLILSIQSPNDEICTVAGLVSEYQNSFGKKFDQISVKLNFQKRHDMFLSNIIQIKKQDLMKFVSQLNAGK